MSKAITVRDVPDEVTAELAARAARGGRSLQEYLRGQLIGLAARPDIDSWVEGIGRRTAATGTEVSVEEILAWRDADRR